MLQRDSVHAVKCSQSTADQGAQWGSEHVLLLHGAKECLSNSLAECQQNIQAYYSLINATTFWQEDYEEYGHIVFRDHGFC